MKLKNAAGILLVVLMLSGCATFPPGPSVMVMPGSGKSFEAFQIMSQVDSLQTSSFQLLSCEHFQSSAQRRIAA